MGPYASSFTISNGITGAMNLAQESSNYLLKVTEESQGWSQHKNSGVSSPICNPLDHTDFVICQRDECLVLLLVLRKPF